MEITVTKEDIETWKFMIIGFAGTAIGIAFLKFIYETLKDKRR